MADSSVAITAGSGTNIDTRTEGTNGHHRQVVVIGDPATNDGVAPVDGTAGLKVDLGADNDVTIGAALPAGTNHIGAVGASDTLVSVTPTLDTNAYTSGDTLFDAVEIAGASRASGTNTILHSVTVVDKDDQKAALTLYFFDQDVTFGTANAAPSISDTDAAFYMGHVDIAASDWDDLGGVAVATLRGVGLVMKPNATSLYVAATTGGTPTHTSSGLVLKFGFLRS